MLLEGCRPAVGYRDWRSVASLAVDAVSSAHSKRAYQKALKDFLAWYPAEARAPISRAIVQQYRSVLESAGQAPASVNRRLSSAIRKPATEAAFLWKPVPCPVAGLARALLAEPDLETIEGKRDRAILAVLLDCALRRSELAALDSRRIQQRDGRWVFVDLVGKEKRIRTVPIPPIVKVEIADAPRDLNAPRQQGSRCNRQQTPGSTV